MTAPSEIDYELYALDFHAECEDFCLQTGKPGLCKGQHRTAVSQVKAPVLRVTPNAPGPKDPNQEAANAQRDAAYQAAMVRAQLLGRQMGAKGGSSVVADYGRALHTHQQALAQVDRTRAQAQRQHDNVVAQNAAAQAHYQARLGAAKARDQLYAKSQALAAAAKAQRKPVTHRTKKTATKPAKPTITQQLTTIRQKAAAGQPYALQFQLDEIYAVMSFEHQGCFEGEFCRNPLHPGPCKGWKHMLHSVAPGAYHAYEQQRVAKLNADRVAKIKAYKDAGQAVPKGLLKEITYAQVPKAPTGTPFVAPTPKEAEQAMPATAKEIAAKLTMKHADIAAHKQKTLSATIDAQHAAMANIAQALGTTPLSPKAKAKLADIHAQTPEGGKVTDHPVLAKTIDTLAGHVMQQNPKLGPDDKAKVKSEIAAHVEAGKPGVPQSVAVAKALTEEKAAVPEDPKGWALAITKPGSTDGYKIDKATQLSRETFDAMNKDQQKLVLYHLGVIQKSGTSAHQQHASKLIDKFTKPAEEPKAAVPEVPKAPAASAPSSTSVSSVAVKQATDAVTNPHSSVAQRLAAYDGLAKEDVAQLQPGHAKSIEGDLQDQMKLAHVNGFLASKAAEIHAKLFGTPTPPAAQAAEKFPVAHPDMMAALDMAKPASGAYPAEALHALQKPGANKEEFAKLPKASQDKIVAFLAKNHDAQPVTVQNIGHKLGIPQVDILTPHGNAAGQAETKATSVSHEALHQALEAATMGSQLHAHAKLTKIAKLNAEDYAFLTAAEKSKIVSALAEIHANEPTWAPVAGQVATGLGPKAKSAFDILTAPDTSAMAPHVVAAHDVATGAVQMTDTKKLFVYGKLSAEEFHSLPAPAQAKILDHLEKAHAKFLAPAKKAQVAALAKKFGAPEAGATPPVDALQLGAPSVAQHVAAHLAALKLAGLPTPATVKNVITKAHEAHPGQANASIIAHSWAEEHLTGLPLSAAEKTKLEAKAKAEFEQMIAQGDQSPVSAGVVDTSQHVVSSHLPAGGLAAAGKATALKVAAGMQGGTGGAGASPVAAGTAALAAKHHAGLAAATKIAGGTGTELAPNFEKALISGESGKMLSIVAANTAEKWAKNHLGTYPYGTFPLTKSQHEELTQQAATEIKQMIELGATKPPAGGVLAATYYNSGPDVLAGLMQHLTHAAQGSSGPGAGGSNGTTGKLGKGLSITGIPLARKEEILGAFKMQPGTQLKDTPEENLQAALNVAHALSGQGGGSTLSLTQVLRVVDEQHSKNLGVTNSGMLEKKITDWLATPAGKAWADKAKPDPAVVSKMTSGLQLPAGVKLKAGKKVQAVGGPGPYDASIPSSKFQLRTVAETHAEQNAYMAKTGEQWTPAQASALETYTYSSGPMNNYLRGQSSADASTKQSVIDAQAGMRPLTGYHLLMRGTEFDELPPGFQSAAGAAKMVGKIINEAAFVSTSVDSYGFGGSLRLEIEAGPGTMGAFVEGISHFQHEKELVLAAGTKLRVISVTQENGKTIMRVRVVS
jgi:hypothetical protein